MQNHSCNRVPLRQVARRPRANRAPVQNDVVWADVQVLSQVEVHSLNVLIQRLLSWQTSIALAETRVLVHDTVNFNLLQEVRLQPSLDEVDVLSVSVRQNEGVLGVAINEQHLELTAALAVQEQMVRIHREARDRWLEE